MNTLRYLIGFLCIATLVNAMELEDLSKLDIVKSVQFEENTIRQTETSQSSNSTDVVKTFKRSQGRVTTTGISCRGICSVSMSYNVTINGVSSKYLNEKDSRFRSLLTDTQRTKYDNAKKRYKGGLGVTFLRAVGINLGGRYSKGKVNELRERVENYESLAKEARNIMNSFERATVRVYGSMTVTSYTSVQSEAVAYVRSAKVTLTDGRELRVVGASRRDVRVVDSNTGEELDNEDWIGGADQETDNGDIF